MLCRRHALLFPRDTSVCPATWLTPRRRGQRAGSTFWVRLGMWVESPESGGTGDGIAKRSLIILIKWSTWFAFQVLQLFYGNPGIFPWQYFHPWWGSRKWADSSSNVTGQHPGQSQNSSGKTAWRSEAKEGGGGRPRREMGKVPGLALSHGLGSPGVAPGENVCFLKPGLVLWKLLCTHERYIVKWYPPSEHPLSFSLKLLPHF